MMVVTPTHHAVLDGSGSVPRDEAVTLLVCSHLTDEVPGVDAGAVAAHFADRADVDADVVRSLCRRPLERAGDAPAPMRLVLGLCGRGFRDLDLERDARSAGLDPLGIQIVDLAGLAGIVATPEHRVSRAAALMEAAVTRARFISDTTSRQVAPRFARMQQRVSRRSLFSLPPLRYQPVATLDRSSCAADIGCRRCVDVCPADAVVYVNGRINIDRGRCRGCAVCVVDCPVRAMELAGFSEEMLAAEIDAVLSGSALEAGDCAPLLICQPNLHRVGDLASRGLPYPTAWIPVAVPCTGALPAGVVLGALADGARGVGVVECGGDCAQRQDDRTRDTVEYSRELVDLLGGVAERVVWIPATEREALADALNSTLPPERLDPSNRRSAGGGTGPGASAASIIALADSLDVDDPVAFDHHASPLGLVSIDTAACTACGACAQGCPTAALTFEDGQAATLSFDPSRCTGCRLCVARCPENARGAITVQPTTSLQALRQGVTAAMTAEIACCESCGGPIASDSTLSRIEQLLGEQMSDELRLVMRTRCSNCRGFV
jgi:ferredoxin/coenzyme F420-reducing hydrogenase delta subunit